MPLSVEWDNPQRTIIRGVFDGKWDADDLHGLITAARGLIETVDHSVDSIYDFTRSTSSPTSALAILQGLDVWRVKNERLVIAVNANGYIKTMGNIGRKLAPKTFAHLLFVGSLNVAYKIIDGQVPTTVNASIELNNI